jgi:hypothetical protein
MCLVSTSTNSSLGEPSSLKNLCILCSGGRLGREKLLYKKFYGQKFVDQQIFGPLKSALFIRCSMFIHQNTHCIVQ